MLPDMIAFTKIVKEPLFDVSRNTMASNFEDYLIHNLNTFNEIPEKKPFNSEIEQRRRDPKYEGAFVFQPTPGLYENIGFFDFSSMYGSIIVSYNLSKPTLTKNPKNSYKGEYNKEKFYFTKKQGFIPTLMSKLIDERRIAKKEYNKINTKGILLSDDMDILIVRKDRVNNAEIYSICGDILGDVCALMQYIIQISLSKREYSRKYMPRIAVLNPTKISYSKYQPNPDVFKVFS